MKNDLIRRADAIDAVGSMLRRKFGIGGDLAEITLAELPSAQPERKKGKWIEYNATGKKQWMCSECCVEEKNPKVARFCYWCGAEMRGEDDEADVNTR